MMTGGIVPVLAQAEPVGPVFFWLFILMGLLIVAAAGVLLLRRWYRNDDDAAPIGFTLGDLRQLHREGKMSDDEFERAKAQMIASARRAIDRQAAKAGGVENVRGKTDVELKSPSDDELL